MGHPFRANCVQGRLARWISEYAPFRVIVNVVDDLFVLTDVRNDVDIECAFVSDHVRPDLFHREGDRLLDLLEKLKLLDLVVGELILCRDQNALISKQFLALLLGDDLLRRLLRGIKSKWRRVQCKRIQEAFAPVVRV